MTASPMNFSTVPPADDVAGQLETLGQQLADRFRVAPVGER
jgi:hypothetical protein